MDRAPTPAEIKQALQRVARGNFSSSETRDKLLEVILRSEDLPPGKVAWMLFRPDRRVREAGAALLQRAAPRAVADAFVAEGLRQPPAALRAAASTFLPKAHPGVLSRLNELAGSDRQEIVRIVILAVLSAPPSPRLPGLLWRVVEIGDSSQRIRALEHLEELEPDEGALSRWRELLDDPEPNVHAISLRVLAARAPERFKELLVAELPRADQETRKVLVEALSRLAQREGVPFAGAVLPLLAAGDAPVREAAVAILRAIPDRSEVIRRFVDFSRNLVGWIRERALESLLLLGPDAAETVRALLRDPDPSIRATALAMVESMGGGELFDAVVPLLQDEDWWVRVGAANVLAQLGDPRAVPPLVTALQDDESRWAAVEALGRLGDPRALPALAKQLTDPSKEVRVEALLALRNFDHPNLMAAFRRVAENDPNRIVRTRAFELAEELAARTGQPIDDLDRLRSTALRSGAKEGDPRIHTLLIAARGHGASDLHLTPNRPPLLRVGVELLPADAAPMDGEAITAMLREILDEGQWRRLAEARQLDLCYYVPTAGRFRGNLFIDRTGLNAVFRVIPETAPTLPELGLPGHLRSIVHEHQGLVLVAGPSGSGKSTTLTALVNLFNEERSAHIITLEDPVEFVHPFKHCLVNQREVGRHTTSFSRALRAALREDPDIIVIGDLRDNETVSLALTAAETGHIVLATLSSTGAIKAVDRIVTSFPAEEQPQVRVGLSESLRLVIAQKLLQAKNGRSQVACFEILKGTPSVSNMIREGRTLQLRSAMQTGKSYGMMTFDDSLKQLLAKGVIARDTALRAALTKQDFQDDEGEDSSQPPETAP